MTTDVNIFKDEWCELLFNGRNQRYGAFEIRRTTGKRHLMAVLVTLSIVISGFSISMIHKKKIELKKPYVIISGSTILENPIIQKPIENHRITRPPRPQLQYTPWVVTPDEKITEQSNVPTNDSLSNTNVQIGNQTIIVEGPVGPGPPDDPGVFVEPEKIIHEYVSQMPQFPGGDTELLRFLSKKINYPTIAIDNRSSGVATIKFVVNYKGEISDVEVARGFDVNCENEAMRVIKSMPKWIPGKQNGNPVNVRVTVPVRFSLIDTGY